MQCLTLLSLGYTAKQVETWINVNASTGNKILKKAKDRGFNPKEDPRILEHHVEDGRRTGRPRKQRLNTNEADVVQPRT